MCRRSQTNHLTMSSTDQLQKETAFNSTITQAPMAVSDFLGIHKIQYTVLQYSIPSLNRLVAWMCFCFQLFLIVAVKMEGVEVECYTS